MLWPFIFSFPPQIELGSTNIRVGTSIFGYRERKTKQQHSWKMKPNKPQNGRKVGSLFRVQNEIAISWLIGNVERKKSELKYTWFEYKINALRFNWPALTIRGGSAGEMGKTVPESRTRNWGNVEYDAKFVKTDYIANVTEFEEIFENISGSLRDIFGELKKIWKKTVGKFSRLESMWFSEKNRTNFLKKSY